MLAAGFRRRLAEYKMSAAADLKRMVREQLLGGGIRSRRVLGAFLRVDRVLFVPPEAKARSYADCPLPIGLGQTISQPLMVAEMLEALDLHAGQTLLEVGAGSGYVLALAAAMGAEVYGIERIAELAAAIPARFEILGLPKPSLLIGDGSLGWPGRAPFDRIIVSAACPEPPPALTEQLADGGVLVVPSGGRRLQRLHRVQKSGGRITTEVSTACVFVPLIGRSGFAED